MPWTQPSPQKSQDRGTLAPKPRTAVKHRTAVNPNDSEVGHLNFEKAFLNPKPKTLRTTLIPQPVSGPTAFPPRRSGGRPARPAAIARRGHHPRAKSLAAWASGILCLCWACRQCIRRTCHYHSYSYDDDDDEDEDDYYCCYYCCSLMLIISKPFTL